MARSTRAAPKEKAGTPELDEVLGQIRKNYGTGVVSRANEIHQPERIPTGIFTLDFALLGGIPFNRVTQLEGHKHAGKSSVAFRILGNAQRQFSDQEAVLLDIEGTYDSVWGEKLGVDSERLLVVQPETGESAMDIMDALIRTKDVSIIAVDSVAALAPMKELERSAEDGNRVGQQALMVGAAIRKAVAGMIAERNKGHLVTILMLNQYRCLDKATRVWTRRGLVPIGTVRAGDEVEAPSGYAEVLQVADSGRVPGVEVAIKQHNPLRMSLNHRHMIVGGDGMAVEALASDLRVGEWVILSPETTIHSLGCDEDRENAAFLGAYFADGSVTVAQGRSDPRLQFTEVDDNRRQIVRKLMFGMFEGAGSYTGANSSVGRAGVALIERYGSGYRGREKQVPRAVLEGGEETVREFLRTASFDTHGFTRNKFYWTFETEDQAACVASLLRGFGVRATRTKGPMGGFTYLSISASDAVRYRDRIGFAEARKQEAAQDFQETSDGARGKYDVVPPAIVEAVFGEARARRLKNLGEMPHYGALGMVAHKGLNASRIRLLEFACEAAKQDVYFRYWVDQLRLVRYAEITALTSLEIDAVDIEVEGGLFFADGVLTHNSKIGGFSPAPDPVQVAGGKALGFANSVEIAIKNKEKMGKDARDIESVEENEHAFTIKKNKLNGGLRSGEFRMRRIPDESLGLHEGDIDDAGTMLVYAKKFGAYSGGGSSWTLRFWGEEHTFRGATDACVHLYADSGLKWRLRNFLIHEQARYLGMPQSMLDRFLPEGYEE